MFLGLPALKTRLPWPARSTRPHRFVHHGQDHTSLKIKLQTHHDHHLLITDINCRHGASISADKAPKSKAPCTGSSGAPSSVGIGKHSTYIKRGDGACRIARNQLNRRPEVAVEVFVGGRHRRSCTVSAFKCFHQIYTVHNN